MCSNSVGPDDQLSTALASVGLGMREDTRVLNHLA